MKKALIVGLNNYPGCKLAWCDNDAIAMKELIESNGDGSPNFDVIPITDSCTKSNLESAIRKLFADDADIALLYFFFFFSDADGGYLCTTDFSENDYGVRMTDILEIVNNSRCKNKVIILDCCFAAKMGESVMLNNNSLLGDGVTIIAASQSWQTSGENSSIQHGIFTELLIQGLKGGAADISGNITPASLYSFVDQSLGAWQQRPVFKTNISQFLPLRTYEYTNAPDVEHPVTEPYADVEHVNVFKELQLFESVGLVEPVGTDHMYFAAMENRSCKLTALGLHYWKLSKDRRF